MLLNPACVPWSISICQNSVDQCIFVGGQRRTIKRTMVSASLSHISFIMAFRIRGVGSADIMKAEIATISPFVRIGFSAPWNVFFQDTAVAPISTSVQESTLELLIVMWIDDTVPAANFFPILTRPSRLSIPRYDATLEFTANNSSSKRPGSGTRVVLGKEYNEALTRTSEQMAEITSCGGSSTIARCPFQHPNLQCVPRSS